MRSGAERPVHFEIAGEAWDAEAEFASELFGDHAHDSFARLGASSLRLPCVDMLSPYLDPTTKWLRALALGQR